MTSTEIFALEPLGALVNGIMILIVPHLLNYFIAGYLIFTGLAGTRPQLL